MTQFFSRPNADGGVDGGQRPQERGSGWGGGIDDVGDVGEGGAGEGVGAGGVFYRSLFKKIITNHFLSHLNAGRRKTGMTSTEEGDRG